MPATPTVRDLGTQIVGIVDMYDALTTARPYRPALTRQAAFSEIERCRGWWSDAVFAAFVRSQDGARTAAGPALAAVPARTTS